MEITLDVPDDLAAQLSREAAELGIPLTEHMIRVLANRGRLPEHPLTGAELVRYWSREGIIGSRRDIEDPAALSRELRHHNQNRPHAY